MKKIVLLALCLFFGACSEPGEESLPAASEAAPPPARQEEPAAALPVAAPDNGGFALLNDTGQTRCFDGQDWIACKAGNVSRAGRYPRQDAHFGQDAAALAGVLKKTGAGSAGFDFTKVCNNGVVAGTLDCPAEPQPGMGVNQWGCTIDNGTGLMWELKVSDRGLRDKNHQYVWHSDAPEEPGTRETCANTLGGKNCTTRNYVAAVNRQGLCGHRDWRLPSRHELTGIVHYGGAELAVTGELASIDAQYFPNTPSNYYYWTRDSYVAKPYSAWGVNFREGRANGYFTFDANHVRLVRGRQVVAKFTDHGDGTVGDASNGLVWMKCSIGQTYEGGGCRGKAGAYTWQQALAAATRANSAKTNDRADWRLPNVKELESLVQVEKSNPAIDTGAFPNTAPDHYWSSTPFVSSPINVWSINFLDGISYGQVPTDYSRVRLVRSGQSFEAPDSRDQEEGQ
ncbi:MAG: DUF1566 domain-containing protein [Zoogloeaceae bacterium]|jgi:hypothetical protein|nr:DUF1566 domain-containing protein [Zoogloeaceae bacterium]